MSEREIIQSNPLERGKRVYERTEREGTQTKKREGKQVRRKALVVLSSEPERLPILKSDPKDYRKTFTIAFVRSRFE